MNRDTDNVITARIVYPITETLWRKRPDDTRTIRAAFPPLRNNLKFMLFRHLYQITRDACLETPRPAPTLKGLQKLKIRAKARK